MAETIKTLCKVRSVHLKVSTGYLFLISADDVFLTSFRVTWTCLCARSVHGWEMWKDALEKLSVLYGPSDPTQSKPIRPVSQK